MLKRAKLHIQGVVQGVGFRPTVYRYATSLDLTGFVNNTSHGVDIEIEGDEKSIDNFIEILKREPPPLAKITSFQHHLIPTVKSHTFEIIKSESSGEKDVLISPDIATCNDCLKEFFNPNDRRYLYPFINCTNCGPRFSIIKDRPYDRPLTSMAKFKMCQECQEEYDNPNSRRFHAQPNACPKCGPKLILRGRESKIPPVGETLSLLKEGKIAAIKGLGGFNIVCDAQNLESVTFLRTKKRRHSKSFALMMPSLEIIEKYCHVGNLEKRELYSPEAPIVLLRKKDSTFDHISPDNNYLGVMLPYTPLHHLISREFEALVFTSANRVDEPIATTDDEATDLLGYELVDFILSNDREIVNRNDDSIVQFIGERRQIIRRSRGFAPLPVSIQSSMGSSLSLGADLKNTFALKRDSEVFLSQHIGDLKDIRNFDYQDEQIKKFSNLLEISSKNKNVDAHPGYENFDKKATKVFHHHAHALSVMAEHQLLKQEVLAVVADGTGFGEDGQIWGFECLEINEDYSKFNRTHHLGYFPLPGGDKAAKECDRITTALNYQYRLGLQPERAEMIEAMIENKINSPLCSSLGRLFDGVSHLLGLVEAVEYEAQGAIILQREAELAPKSPRRYTTQIEGKVLSPEKMLKELLVDLKNNLDKKTIALKFHYWVVDSIYDIVRKTKRKVVFSGGCFQNALLVTLLEEKLKDTNIQYYFNEQVPPGDGGIALGQAVMPKESPCV